MAASIGMADGGPSASGFGIGGSGRSYARNVWTKFKTPQISVTAASPRTGTNRWLNMVSVNKTLLDG